MKGNLENYVDEALYKKLYEPNGWRIVEDDLVEDEATNEVKAVKSDTELKNLQSMKKKKKSNNTFTDNLFKSDKEE
jgi:hypothetical protein